MAHVFFRISVIGFDQRNTRSSKSLLLYSITGRCIPLVMAFALMFYDHLRHSAAINNQQIHPLAVYGIVCGATRRENLPHTYLREYPISLALTP